MEDIRVTIHTPYIQLDQLLKKEGLIQTGGQVKALLAAGLLFLNGEQVTERRKKIRSGDRVEVKNECFLLVTAEERSE